MTRNAVLVSLLAMAWGLNWVAIRLALDEIPPWTLRTIAFWSATALMFAYLRARGISARVPRRHWWRLAVVGLLAVVAYNIFSAYAQLTASTTRTAVLSYTMPIWAVLFARIALKEPFDSRRRIGLAFGAAGLVALGLPIAQTGQLTIGLLYAIMSGMVWAAGSTVLKRLPVEAPPVVVTAWQLLLGGLVSVVGMVAIDGWPNHLPVQATTWGGLVYNIVIGQALGTALWFTILDVMPAGIAAIGSLLVPAVGVLGATLILGERPTIPDWIGAACIVSAAAATLLRGPGSAEEPSGTATDSSRGSGTLRCPNRPVPSRDDA